MIAETFKCEPQTINTAKQYLVISNYITSIMRNEALSSSITLRIETNTTPLIKCLKWKNYHRKRRFGFHKNILLSATCIETASWAASGWSSCSNGSGVTVRGSIDAYSWLREYKFAFRFRCITRSFSATKAKTNALLKLNNVLKKTDVCTSVQTVMTQFTWAWTID